MSLTQAKPSRVIVMSLCFLSLVVFVCSSVTIQFRYSAQSSALIFELVCSSGAYWAANPQHHVKVLGFDALEIMKLCHEY